LILLTDKITVYLMTGKMQMFF